MNSMVREANEGGTATLTTPEFSARAGDASAVANFRLTASTIRADVVKSDWRSCRCTIPLGATEGAGRSTVPPLGLRPTVGWFTVCEVPPRPATNPPVTTGPCATA